jgi:hypothetical protein
MRRAACHALPPAAAAARRTSASLEMLLRPAGVTGKATPGVRLETRNGLVIPFSRLPCRISDVTRPRQTVYQGVTFAA